MMVTTPPLPAEGRDLLVDALIGGSLRGAPRAVVATPITRANAGAAPVPSLDAPGGLSATSGATAGACVQADATPTLPPPKAGQLGPVGRLLLPDISVPPLMHERVGLAVGHPFAGRPIVELDKIGRP